jgi:hypothetical protein
MITRTVFATLLLALSINSFAQQFLDGYIIKHSGDTIYGQLKNFYPDSKAIEVSFRINANASTEYYTAKDLLGYAINGTYYDSKSVKIKGEAENRSFFLKRMMEGTHQLYSLSQDFSDNTNPLETSPIPREQAVVTDDRIYDKPQSKMPYNRRGVWYLVAIPKADNPILLEPQNFRETLIGVFGPCDAISKKAKYSYTDNGVMTMIKDLANCHQLDIRPLFEMTASASTVKFSIASGINSVATTSGISPFEGIDFDRVLAPKPGFYIHFPFKNGLEVQTGIDFTAFSTDGSSTYIVPEFYSNAGEEIRLDHQMNFTFISIPFHLKYYPIESQKWYLSGGVAVSRGIGNSSGTEVIKFVLDENGEAIQIKESKDIPEGVSQITKFVLGYQIAVGRDINIKDKLPIFLAIDFSQGQSLNENSNGIINTFTSFGLNVGCYF